MKLRKDKKQMDLDRMLQAVPVFLMLLALVYIGINNHYFFKVNNLISVLLQTASLAIMAMGMTLVLITGGIDLSIPPVMGASAILGTLYMQKGGNPLTAFLLMLAVAMICGLINGFAIAYLKMIPFIVTLSLQMITYGACLWLAADGVSGVAEGFQNVLLFKVGGLIPLPILLVVLLMFFVELFLKKSFIGRQLYVTGTNVKMADVSGIPSREIILAAYVLSGLFAALAGAVYIARMGAASASMGADTAVTDIVGAAVIGGASTFGGIGTAKGAVFGAVFITIIGNAANMLHLSYNVTMMLKGALILAFVALDMWRRKRRGI